MLSELKCKGNRQNHYTFVVSDKLNETAAQACIQIGYHNWYNCNGQTIDANSYYSRSKLLVDLGRHMTTYLSTTLVLLNII